MGCLHRLSTRCVLLGLGQGSCIGVFPIFSSYFPYSPWLCAHAHHLLFFLSLLPTWLQLLAPLYYHLRNPCSSPIPSPRNMVPHPHGPVALTEALPFIVCTLGFNKPHPHRRHEFRWPAQVCRRNHPRLFVYGVYPVARIKLLLVSTIHAQ